MISRRILSRFWANKFQNLDKILLDIIKHSRDRSRAGGDEAREKRRDSSSRSSRSRSSSSHSRRSRRRRGGETSSQPQQQPAQQQQQSQHPMAHDVPWKPPAGGLQGFDVRPGAGAAPPPPWLP